PWRVSGFVTGTVLAPIVMLPLSVTAARQSSVAGLLRGQSANRAKSPLGWCSTANAEPAADRQAVARIATTGPRVRARGARPRRTIVIYPATFDRVRAEPGRA